MALAPIVSVAPAGAKPALCSLAKSEVASQSKSTNAIVKAIEAGNWATAKQALLSSFNGESKAEALAISALSSAPAKVKAAGAVALKFVATEKSVIEKSTSVSQFESSIEAATKNPQLVSAEKTLESYQTAKCGPLTPVTTPTT
jgi:hypothetical protein